MKTFVWFFVPIGVCLYGFSIEQTDKPKPKTSQTIACEEKVWICNSMNSKAYHLSKECRGLQSCRDTIINICKTRAEHQFGRVLCGYETDH